LKAICSLHNHSTVSDGELSPDELLLYLKDSGYNVIAITDHMKIAMPWKIPDDILFIHGIEWRSSLGYEVVALNPSVEPELGKFDYSQTPVKWIAHPQLGFRDYYGQSWNRTIDCNSLLSTILTYRLDGYELYNSGIEQLTPLEVSRITELSEVHVNRYAVDDFHVKGQEFTSWIEMDVNELDLDEVLDNLKLGNYVIKVDETVLL